jgi:hypothetical protein
MLAAATTTSRASIARGLSWRERLYRTVRFVLIAADALAPPRCEEEPYVLPPDWFKYPPI